MRRFVLYLTVVALSAVGAWRCTAGTLEEAVEPVAPMFTAAETVPVELVFVPEPVLVVMEPEPVPEPAAPVVRVVAAGDPSLVALVVSTFPEDPETATRIVSCESRWDPAARSGTGDTGLFQINDIHRGAGGVAAGMSVSDLMDPVTNVRVARMLYDQSGWYPWVCY